MTVDENLDLGAFLRQDKAGIAADKERVLALFPRLAERIRQKAGTMSGGEQQMLGGQSGPDGPPQAPAARRAVDGPGTGARRPHLRTIATIREQGTTILLVEQNALAALRIADRAYVLESGSLKLQGKAADLAKDPEVVNAYLGG
jgi:branched-chain amino acid transport system ATP-binding protein